MECAWRDQWHELISWKIFGCLPSQSLMLGPLPRDVGLHRGDLCPWSLCMLGSSAIVLAVKKSRAHQRIDGLVFVSITSIPDAIDTFNHIIVKRHIHDESGVQFKLHPFDPFPTRVHAITTATS
jgi:hypothetical protein